MPAAPPDPDPADVFLAAFVPAVASRARRVFRRLPCPGRRDDAVQDALTFAWAMYLSALRRGRRPTPPRLARWAVARAAEQRNLPGERRPGGGKADRDALSPKAQRRDDFRAVNPGPEGDEDFLSQLAGAHDPIPDVVAARLDLAAFLSGRTDTERRVLAALLAGESRVGAARRAGVTPEWVTTLRRRWRPFAAQLVG